MLRTAKNLSFAHIHMHGAIVGRQGHKRYGQWRGRCLFHSNEGAAEREPCGRAAYTCRGLCRDKPSGVPSVQKITSHSRFNLTSTQRAAESDRTWSGDGAARGVARGLARGVGIRELEPPKCGPRGGDQDEAALPHPGGLGSCPEGCPRSPPPGATFVFTWRLSSWPCCSRR